MATPPACAWHIGRVRWARARAGAGACAGARAGAGAGTRARAADRTVGGWCTCMPSSNDDDNSNTLSAVSAPRLNCQALKANHGCTVNCSGEWVMMPSTDIKRASKHDVNDYHWI